MRTDSHEDPKMEIEAMRGDGMVPSKRCYLAPETTVCYYAEVSEYVAMSNIAVTNKMVTSEQLSNEIDFDSDDDESWQKAFDAWEE